jgi:hypothetical protein
VPEAPGDEPPPPEIARVLDVLRGGYSHFPSDQAVADEVERLFPGARKALSGEVDFLLRVGCWAARRGISRLVHAGAASYLPGRNLHDAAQAINPEARVIYVNRVPDLHDDAAALLGVLPGCQAAYDDGLDLLAIPEVAAMAAEGERVAVVYSLVLSYVTDQEAAALLASLADGLPSGSCVAVSLILPADGPGGDEVIAAAAAAGTRLERRTREDVAGWLDGMDVTAGVTDVRLVPDQGWPDIELPPTARAQLVGAVALVRLADHAQPRLRLPVARPCVQARLVVGDGLPGDRLDHHLPPGQGLDGLPCRAHPPRGADQGAGAVSAPEDGGADLGEGLPEVVQGL